MLAEVRGKTTESTPSHYQIVAQEGITEIVKLKPYRKHEGMEQNGTPVALFYVVDDPTQREKLLTGDQDRK